MTDLDDKSGEFSSELKEIINWYKSISANLSIFLLIRDYSSVQDKDKFAKIKRKLLDDCNSELFNLTLLTLVDIKDENDQNRPFRIQTVINKLNELVNSADLKKINAFYS